jgi:hypothetical protein
MSFIVYCLPRSRSAWLAYYLNYPFAVPLQPVGHDVAPLCKSVEAFVKAYKDKELFGSVELSGMIGWQVIRQELPDLKVVVMRRPLQEVYNSITMLGYDAHLTNLAELNETLNMISEQPGVFSINSSDLDAPVTGKWLFEYLLEQEFDFDWWNSMIQTNIQVNMKEAIAVKDETDARYALYHKDVLERMKNIKSVLH